MEKTRYFLEYLLFKIIYGLLYPFPRRFYISVGRFTGYLLFYLLKSKRKIAIDNLTLAFGKEKDKVEIELIAKKCFQHFGIMVFDLMWFMKKGEKEIKTLCKIEKIENLTSAIAHGKGILLLSAHFGNWELIPLALAINGHPINAIARKFDNPYLDRVVTKFRERYGNKVIYKQDAKREVIEFLCKGGCVGILPDQNTLKNHGIFVDFFGVPACTSTGLAVFHLKYNSPIVPVFCFPDSNFNYIIEVKKPIFANSDDSLLKVTHQYTKIIEDEIRSSPHLWLWFHQRWKEKP
ncbi:MAG: lysophospholipid acyltransferase family protein [Candidatus Aminicenantia bacterium]